MVHLFRKTASIAKDSIQLPEIQEYEPARSCNIIKISVIYRTILQPEPENWVTVSNELYGIITFEPKENLYHKLQYIVATGIHHCNPG